MRKNLIISAMAFAALAFVGCSKDEVVSESPTLNNAIEFGTYLGRSAKTRSLETTDATIQKAESAGGGFGVLASYTDQSVFNTDSESTNTPNFMYNQKVTYSNSKWTYSPVKYWPTTSGDKISFFAYAPYSAQSTTGANGIELSANTARGIPTVKFTIATDAANMVDFVADAVYNQSWQQDKEGDDPEDTDGVNESVVTFTLLHELTRVGFKAQVDENIALGESATSNTRVAIKEIKLNASGVNFYKSATYTFPASNETDQTPVRGGWSYDNGDATPNTTDYDISGVLDLKDFSTGSDLTLATGKTFNEGNNYQAVWLSPTQNNATSIFKGGSTANDATDDAYLFLIPPAGETGVTATAGSDPMSITVSYDIITADANLAKGYSITSATKTVSLAGVDTTALLKQGKSYVYTLTFGIDEIQVSAKVDSSWGDASDDVYVGYDVDVTNN